MEGTIVKGIAGFYYVKHDDTVYQCRARGVFKKEGITPAVGDQVEFTPGEGEEDDGVVTCIRPRKNHFIRPPVANVDCFVVVLAAAHPKPNLAVADKFLVMAEKSGADIVLCINKVDLGDACSAAGKEPGKGSEKRPVTKGAAAGTIQQLRAIYEPVYPVVCVSGTTGRGVEELRALLAGKQAALAGPSGVGKSTLLNCLLPEAGAETGDVSHKTRRGRHTTRHCELFDLGGGTAIFDTPGFTSFDILEADEDELQHLYPEFSDHLGKCRYDDCRHLQEPDCAVRAALAAGQISQQRYDSYRTLLAAIQEKKRR